VGTELVLAFILIKYIRLQLTVIAKLEWRSGRWGTSVVENKLIVSPLEGRRGILQGPGLGGEGLKGGGV
jgi:hypothetical protein